MSTFSIRALILGHHEMGMQISQPILNTFELNSPEQNLLFELFTVIFLYQMYIQLRFKRRACFVSSVFCICLKLHFSLLYLKRAHKC